MEHAHDLAPCLGAGCSALSWQCLDGACLLGRNYDFSRLAQGSAVTFLPPDTPYHTCIDTAQPPLRSVYGCAGMGLLQLPGGPVLYEGVNERGLMGGQLYYREFAHYPQSPRPGTRPLQPPFAVYHLLAQCATVDEAAALLEEETTLVSVPLLGTVPPLHWMFSDRTGESMVMEPDLEGLHLYRSALGVLTNSPGYPWHRLNLLNYAGIRALDYDGVEMGGEHLAQCFSGSGAQGLPGDWSSPARFVRLAFLKQLAQQGEHEDQGVARLFRLLQSAAFPLGAVRVSHQGHLTQLDQEVSPFDYTLYSCVMCAHSARYYWTSYENQQVRYLDLTHLAQRREPAQFDLGAGAAFHPVC